MTKKKPHRDYVYENIFYNFTMTTNSLIRRNYQHWLNLMILNDTPYTHVVLTVEKR